MGAREHVQLVHGLGCMCIRHQQERAEAAAKVERVATPDLRDSREEGCDSSGQAGPVAEEESRAAPSPAAGGARPAEG